MRHRREVSLLERLENRSMMSATNTFVYVESNNPNPGQNAILAYKENTTTGALTALPNGRFLTGGTGYRNAGPQLGPDDSDKEVISTPDGKYLFAVNQGSNTVAEFLIKNNGNLQLASDAPFSSGGTEPVSLSFSNDQLHVLNRGNSAEGTAGTIAPTLASFFVGEDGNVFPVPSATITFSLNLSPAQVLTSADGKFTFVDNFATPSNLKVSLANTIEPFIDNGNGTLTPVANGKAGLPTNPPLVLGLVEDPVHHILYSGQAPSGGVATFTYNDTTGKVAYVGAVASPGKATCWLNISPNGKYLYATDSATDAISVYSLANPLKPALIQEFYLNGPNVKSGSPANASPTSQDFQFSFDSTGNYLYVVNHTTDDAFQQGNQLSTLSVGSNGKLSESTGPLFFSAAYVPATAHVLGIDVVTKASGSAFPANVLAKLLSDIGVAASSNPSLQSLLDTLLQDLSGSL
jgi:hypothetical protein